MGFAARLEFAEAWEREVAAAIEARGWAVEPYGQALLTEAARQMLRRDPHAQHRWLPDLLAHHQGKAVSVLVDAKNSNGPNYAIEKSALAALVAHEANALMPLYIVFSDWAVVRACELWEIVDDERIARTGSYRGSGSGTPFWVIRKGMLPRTFDSTFGSVNGNAT